MRIPKSLAALGHVFLSLSTASTAQQQPLLDPSNEASSTSQWRFNFSSEAPHYFASVHGLLQQWSNTFFPNGHSIVPCEIAPFTKLYHGRMDGDVPPSPEWFAFDMRVPPPSYMISANLLQWHGIRNNGRVSKFTYAHLPNHTPS